MAMINKLQSLFPDALLFKEQPQESLEAYYVFFNRSEQEWLAIPKTDLNDKELLILKTLYELIELNTSSLSPQLKSWHQFLFQNGQLPVFEEKSIRMVQFQIRGNGVEQTELESALKGFFSDDILIIWENKQAGTVILYQNLSFISEKELESMAKTFESDFFVTTFFYLGKEYPFSPSLKSYFTGEKEIFNFGLTSLNHIHIFTFERIFPSYVAFHLPEVLKEKVNQSIIKILEEDPEMYMTLKVFLENNLNASQTAKILYIHRNTLQYRLDKFTEKTGIQLKDFHSAFTVFLTVLVFEHNKAK